MINGLDHVAIVVESTEAALEIWRDRLGFPVLFSDEVNERSLRLTHLDLGSCTLQLVEALRDDHPLREQAATRGTHLHHICFRVGDVGAALDQLPAMGLAAGERQPHQGTQGNRALFLDRHSTGNVLVELTGR